jgi:hypothetical protein
LITSAYGQTIWEKKPYTEWSMGEALRVLDDSPWAQTQIESGKEAFTVTIRLRSALPIRQALIRQRQLQLNYGKFSPAEKARFDADAKDFLTCSDCAEYYIVTLTSAFNHPYPLRVLEGLSLDELKSQVSLTNDKGERRSLAGFIPPRAEGKEAMFIFQRFDDHGSPLLTTADKQLHFKIEQRVFEGKTLVPIKKFTFGVSKLIQNGEVMF